MYTHAYVLTRKDIAREEDIQKMSIWYIETAKFAQLAMQ